MFEILDNIPIHSDIRLLADFRYQYGIRTALHPTSLYVKADRSETIQQMETYLFAWGWPRWWWSSRRRHSKCASSSSQRTVSARRTRHSLQNQRDSWGNSRAQCPDAALETYLFSALRWQLGDGEQIQVCHCVHQCSKSRLHRRTLGSLQFSVEVS